MEHNINGISGNSNVSKNIRIYQENNINVIIEIPVQDKERDMEGIADIKKIMNDELLFQINQ